MDWLNDIPRPDGGDFGYGEFMLSVDAIVMGANTFDVVRSFDTWPYEKPVFVASSRLTVPPEGYEDRITLVRGTAAEIAAQVRRAGHERLYVDGGQLISSFLNAGLLDEIIITRIPVILGAGIPLFQEVNGPVLLKHISTRRFKNGLVQSRYSLKTSK